MGDIRSSKMPTAKTVQRTDDPNEVQMYKTGGKAAKSWIAGAIKKPGALRASLGVKGDKPIPAKTLAKAAKAPGKMGQRARLAQTLKGMNKK
jgi:hypothetical protein